MLEYTTGGCGAVSAAAALTRLTPVNQGWSCPKCGSAHAPHVQTCPQSSWGHNYPLPPACSPYTVTCGSQQAQALCGSAEMSHQGVIGSAK
jgi:hypothetical protein